MANPEWDNYAGKPPYIETVFRVVADEIAYSEKLDGSRVDGHKQSVGEMVLLINRYSHHATDAWCDKAGNEAALHVIRKIAAIACRCLIEHGAPKRTGEKNVPTP